MDLLIQEIDALIRELGAQLPGDEIRDIKPATVLRLFNQTIGRRLPRAQSSLFSDLERNLEDAGFADFVDPELLRGMAQLAYYSLQAQAATVRDPVIDRIMDFPGADLLAELRHNLSGTTVRDLVDPDTWKGLWYIAAYTVQTKLQELREWADES